MNTNLPVSVCVIRRQQILTHILLIFCSKFAYSAMQEGMEEKTCNLAAIVCNCNTFDEDPKVEISNKSTECWSTVNGFFTSHRKIQPAKRSSRVGKHVKNIPDAHNNRLIAVIKMYL